MTTPKTSTRRRHLAADLPRGQDVFASNPDWAYLADYGDASLPPVIVTDDARSLWVAASKAPEAEEGEFRRENHEADAAWDRDEDVRRRHPMPGIRPIRTTAPEPYEGPAFTDIRASWTPDPETSAGQADTAEEAAGAEEPGEATGGKVPAAQELPTTPEGTS